MIDTNILYYLIEDKSSLTKDVRTIIDDYDTTLYTSAESVKELVVAHRSKKLLANRWKKAEDLVTALSTDSNIIILPVDSYVVNRMAKLRINEAENHYDPSDHIIIAHAITMGLPLISSDRKFPFYRTQGLDLVTNF